MTSNAKIRAEAPDTAIVVLSGFTALPFKHVWRPVMKITAVKPYPAWSVWRNVFLVKVETDAGLYGIGEGSVAHHVEAALVPRKPLAANVLMTSTRAC